MTVKQTQLHGVVDWINEKFSKLASVPNQFLKVNDEHYFQITANLGRICLAFRHMREVAFEGGATAALWDRTVERLFPKIPLAKINLYASAGKNLHWDMDLVNEFQKLTPPEIVDFHGTPVEPMEDQLHRLGLTNPAAFEEWAETNESAREKKRREDEELKAKVEAARAAQVEKERLEKERISRETKARHEAEIRRLAQEESAFRGGGAGSLGPGGSESRSR
jgi:hypothetical protein